MQPMRPRTNERTRGLFGIAVLLAASLWTGSLGAPLDAAAAVGPRETMDAGALACGKTGSYTAIWEVQGSGHTSPKDGQTVQELRGVVTADFQKGTGGPWEPWGFFVQAHEADCDAATSDGLFVYTGSGPKSVTVGNLVKVTKGKVDEYQGPGSFVWERTLTELVCLSGCGVSTLQSNYGVPAAEELSPPTDEALAVDYHEAREGMLVQVGEVSTVVAAVNAYNEFVVVRGTGKDRLSQETGNNGHAIMVDGDGVAAAKCGADGFGYIKTFDTVASTASSRPYGPLNYNFNMYKIQQDDDTSCVSWTAGNDTSYDPAENPPPSASSDVLTIATMNAYNFFDTSNDPAKSDDVLTAAEYDRRSRKLADAVCNANGLNKPPIVALQEVENGNVLAKLVGDISTRCGVTYSQHTVGAPDDRGIEVSYLARSDRVTVASLALRQGCSATNWGVDYESGDPAPDVSCDGSTPYYLHNRPPLELVAKVTLAGSERTLYVLNNHFKSKLGSSACAQKDCTDWRVEEAKHVDALVDARLASNPGDFVVVTGDLNDFYTSAPLDVLDKTQGVLTNVWQDKTGTPGTQGTMSRYSYLYNGVSQTLDHLLVSDNLAALARTTSPRHLSGDWPASHGDDDTMLRSSDHDPLLVGFTFTSGGNATVPGAPTLSATAGDGKVDLSWTTPGDGGSAITGYNVYRGTSSGSHSLLASLGVTNAYTDTAVTNGNTYYYAVTAVNAVGEGAKSNEVSATPASVPQVRINEVEHNPTGDDVGNEYAELYNYGSTTVDLSGWTLTANHGTPVTLALSGTLAAGAYKVVKHTSQWIDNTGEWVTLKDAAGAKIDETPVQSDGQNDGRSWQRKASDLGTWQFVASTEGAANP